MEVGTLNQSTSQDGSHLCILLSFFLNILMERELLERKNLKNFAGRNISGTMKNKKKGVEGVSFCPLAFQLFQALSQGRERESRTRYSFLAFWVRAKLSKVFGMLRFFNHIWRAGLQDVSYLPLNIHFLSVKNVMCFSACLFLFNFCTQKGSITNKNFQGNFLSGTLIR